MNIEVGLWHDRITGGHLGPRALESIDAPHYHVASRLGVIGC